MERIVQKYSYEMCLMKARAYCDKAERAHRDVRSKLVQWGLFSGDREKIISILIEEDLLNETRYAEAFANDKFRFNKWGIMKIEQALKAKGVSERNIRDALKRIDPQAYEQTVKEIAQKRLERESGKGLQNWQKEQKVMRYLLSRGFDSAIVKKVLSA
ncbi:MAG: regulatory protein RecX [Flavobacteriales bacterium]